MYLRKIITTTFIFMFLAGAVAAQDINMTLQSGYDFRIDGDSNVRTWGADAEKVEGRLILTDIDEVSLVNLNPDNIKEMSLTIHVESLDSGSRGLTRNMKSYLKEDDHPLITFNLQEITSIEMQNGSALITAVGIINAAGQNKEVTMNVTATMNDNGSLNFRGEQDLLMTDFGIDPPTAVMGTVRARDEVVVSYNVNFN
jgi:polyisoprenoid-binding protein YceI